MVICFIKHMKISAMYPNKRLAAIKHHFRRQKKMEKSTVSSDNIKKFLARKETEEKKRLQNAQRKKEELLALRSQDKKAQKRVQVMLKRTKSANKSVMEDAIDNVNTADTLNGPNQCDNDDYGYVSQEASAFYNKLIHKYENMPAEPSIFSKGKKEVKDLAAAKDRVKLALQKEAEESELPHKRKRRTKQEINNEIQENCSDTDEELSNKLDNHISKKVEEDSNNKISNVKQKKNYSNLPPPMNFNELMKIAKVKQYEPVMVDVSAKQSEPTRLMTSKEKADFIKEEERKRNRLIRKRNEVVDRNTVIEKNTAKQSEQVKIKIPKINDTKEQTKELINKIEKPIQKKDKNIVINKNVTIQQKPVENTIKLTSNNKKTNIEKITKINNSNNNNNNNTKINVQQYVPKPKVNINKELFDIDKEIELLRKKKLLLEKKAVVEQPKYVPTTITTQAKKLQNNKNKEKIRKKVVPVRRRIESESEHDSDLDDFIDDGPDNHEDYSKVISEIFGYDKSRYRNYNEDDDDECMESNFAQQMREEFVSTRIGIMEDLEDIKKEQEEKRRLKAKKKFKK